MSTLHQILHAVESDPDRPPDAVPPPSDHGGTDGLTITEAAALLHTSRDAIRQRIRRGTIDARKHDGQWYVRPIPPGTDSAGLSTGGLQDGRSRMDSGMDSRVDGSPTHHDRPPDTASGVAQLHHLAELLTEVRRQRDQLEREVSAQRGDIAALQETVATLGGLLAAGDVERTELRRLLSAVMQRAPVPAAPAQQDGHDGMPAAHNVPASPTSPSVPRSAPWWRRILRALSEG